MTGVQTCALPISSVIRLLSIGITEKITFQEGIDASSYLRGVMPSVIGLLSIGDESLARGVLEGTVKVRFITDPSETRVAYYQSGTGDDDLGTIFIRYSGDLETLGEGRPVLQALEAEAIVFEHERSEEHTSELQSH